MGKIYKKRNIVIATIFVLVLFLSAGFLKPMAYTDYATVSVTTTAVITEPANQSGSLLTYSLTGIQATSPSVTGPSDVQTFISNWCGQINSNDTTTGSITVDVGSNSLPLASATTLNCSTTVTTVGFSSGSFTGPKGSFILGGSFQAPAGFSASTFYAPNTTSGSVDFYANLSSATSPPFTSQVDGNNWSVSNWGHSSSSATVTKWGSTPSALRQKQSYEVSLSSIQYDAVTNTATASTAIVIN